MDEISFTSGRAPHLQSESPANFAGQNAIKEAHT